MKTLLCVLVVPLPEGSSLGEGTRGHSPENGRLKGEVFHSISLSYSTSSLRATNKTRFIKESTL